MISNDKIIFYPLRIEVDQKDTWNFSILKYRIKNIIRSKKNVVEK